MEFSKWDIVVIGAGVAGCCIARELSKYDLNILVLDAGLDIAEVTTRANSGIVHAGYDPIPNTLKAKYNIWGANLYPNLSKELGFKYKQNGALIVAFNDEEVNTINLLYKRGIKNGVKKLEIIDSHKAWEIEPELSRDVVAALYVPTSGICDPYQVALKNAENAVNNGTKFHFDSEVTNIFKHQGVFNVQTNNTIYLTKCVVNAAGLNSDEINNMVSQQKIKIIPKRGEYCLFDTKFGNYFSNTIFQCPTKDGKGVLVSPTVHGNLFIGPSSSQQASKDDYSTYYDGLNYIQKKALKSWPGLDMKGLITNFSGLRSCVKSEDFIVGEVSDCAGFYNIAALDSPGLSSSPAIALDIASKIAEKFGFSKKNNFCPTLKVKKRYFEMTHKERCNAVKNNPNFGHVLCRCRQVSVGEVEDALNGPIPVLTIDSLKWRTGATMGRCHGGFCTPELVKYLCQKYKWEPKDLNKRNQNSWMFSQNRADYLQRVEETFESKNNSKINNIDLTDSYDVVVIGGGAAGIAAAKSAINNGSVRVCLIDRENGLGGILKQCIHSGFGLHHFGEELTGPEYAYKEIVELLQLKSCSILTNSYVTDITKQNNYFSVTISNAGMYNKISAKSVVLSSGSRERGFGSLNITGSRPSGIYTAGCAQNFINLQGVLPGKNAVVLGSGDIGLIMARRMVLSAINVKAVYEIMSKPSGLKRNIIQCLEDFNIPLYLSTTVVATHGASRLESVTVQKVTDNLVPVDGTKQEIKCDTLVLSVGLIPEAELAINAGAKYNETSKTVKVNDNFMTDVEGLFVCGNALHIHDLVDFASAEGQAAGKNASTYAKGLNKLEHFTINNNHKDQLEAEHNNSSKTIICTSCPNGCQLQISNLFNDKSVQIVGNKCKRGIEYAKNELVNPSRNISSLIMSSYSLEPCSVKTSKPIPKNQIKMLSDKILKTSIKKPVNVGDIIIRNPLNLDVDIVATKSIL